MAGKSDFLENKVLDHILGNTAYTAPATFHIALFTTSPGDDGTGGTEVSGNNYSRVSVTNNTTNWPNASGGAKANGTAITFATPSGTWGTVTSFGIYDASTGGNLLYFGNLTSNQTINTGNAVEFPIGDLAITED